MRPKSAARPRSEDRREEISGLGNSVVVTDHAFGEVTVVVEAAGNIAGANAFERTRKHRNAAACKRKDTFEASAISRAWPIRPKPVTSVMA